MVKSLSAALLCGALTLPAHAAGPGPLQFSTAPGPTASIARALLGAEREEPLRDDEIVSISEVDLDGDGISELFVFADASYFCGSAGCVPRIYQLDLATAGWRELPIEAEAMLNSEPANWGLAPAHAGNWRVLEMRTPDLRLYFAWNGEAFVQIERK